MKELNNQVCERAEDLIAFLYGELDAAGGRKFERHLLECARCETELSSFGEIRQSIVSWRDESLGRAWSDAAVNNSKPLTVTAITKPSALAAIRGFFTLSPLWMKGATAFASLLFCLCAVLTITYLRNRPAGVVQVPDNKIYTQQELEARLAQEKQKLIESQQKRQPESENQTAAVPPAPPRRTDSQVMPGAKTGYASNTRGSRKPLTRQERQELAADLGLSAAYDDDDLDLGGDRINQAP
jgi:anti-sigma factor RsiW